MIRSRSPILILVQIVLGLITLVGLILANQRFANAYPVTDEFARNWAVIRSYVTAGTSPYDAGISNQAADLLEQPLNGSVPVLSQPFYSAIFLLPFALISDLATAKTAWMLVLELCLIWMAVIATRFTEWQPSLWNWFFLVLFCLLGFPAFKALVDGDMVVLVVVFLGATLVALRFGWDEIGGIALALATIMPEVVLATGIFIMIWAISKRRLRFLVWFFFTLVILIIIGLFFIPDWPIQYLRVLINNGDILPGYFSTFSIATARWPGVGRQLAWILTAGVIVLLLVEWSLAIRKDFRWFAWTACLTITIGFWIGIPMRLANFYVLTLPLVLILATLDQRIPWKRHLLPIAGSLLAIVGIWSIFLKLLFDGEVESLANSMISTVPFLLLIGLFWIRWWCVRPQKLGMDELKAYEAIR